MTVCNMDVVTAPWFERNTDLQHDLKAETVKEDISINLIIMKRRADRKSEPVILNIKVTLLLASKLHWEINLI